MPSFVELDATEASEDLGYSIISQKVDLEVDFISQSLSGSIEILAQPLVKDLKAFRLNSRQSRVLAARLMASKLHGVMAIHMRRSKAEKGQHLFINTNI